MPTLKEIRSGITRDSLREMMRYDPETGLFTWRWGKGSRSKPGARAGSINDRGYHMVWVNGKMYPGHRLAWLYMTGDWPTKTIDHINRNPSDNRWVNLREATLRDQMANKGPNRDNKTGFKGVTILPRCVTRPYRAMISRNGKAMHLGCFATAEEASAAYLEAAKLVHGEFASA